MSRTTENKPVFNFVLNFSVSSQQPCTGQLVIEIILIVKSNEWCFGTSVNGNSVPLIMAEINQLTTCEAKEHSSEIRQPRNKHILRGHVG